MEYGYKKIIDGELEKVEGMLRERLMENGFGVITEINIREKLEEKLGVDFRDYKILGSCHPPSAFESLEVDLNVGMLLPCNFVIWDNMDGDFCYFRNSCIKAFQKRTSSNQTYALHNDILSHFWRSFR